MALRNFIRWISFGLVAAGDSNARSPSEEFFAERLTPGFWRTKNGKVWDSKKLINVLASLEGTEIEANLEELIGNVTSFLTAELATEKGVHFSSMLTAFGALAGFACQMVIREELVAKGQISEADAFVVVDTKDGNSFYMGDLLNEGLAEAKPGNLSVWSLIAGAPESLGQPLPDIREIFSRAAQTIGSPEFGKSNMSSEYLPETSAQDLLKKYWNPIRNLQIDNRRSIGTMHLNIAHAAQQFILKNAKVINATLAAQIVMEAAIPMSKISPDCVPYAYLKNYD